MRPILNVFRKDVWRYWIPAVLVSLLCFASVIQPLFAWDLLSKNETANLFLADLGRWPAIFILIIVVTQEDIVLGERAFWRSRPIGAANLFAAKLLFVGSFVLLPIALATVVCARVLSAPPSLAISMIIENVSYAFLIAIVALFVGSLTKTVLQAAFLAMGGFVVIAGIRSLLDGPMPSLGGYLPWNTDADHSGARVLFACMASIATVCLLSLHHYVTRILRRTVLLAAIAIPTWAFFIGVESISDWVVDRQIVDVPVAMHPRPELDKGIVLTFSEKVWAGYFGYGAFRTKGSDKPIQAPALGFPFRVSELPAGHLLRPVYSGATFTPEGGQPVQLSGLPSYWSFRGMGWVYRTQESALCRQLRLTAPAPEPFDTRIETFVMPRDLPAVVGKVGRMTFSPQFVESGLYETLRILLRTGESTGSIGRRWLIGSIAPGTVGDLRVQLIEQRATSVFIGASRINGSDFADHYRSIGRLYVLFSPSHRQYSIAAYPQTVASGGIVGKIMYPLVFAPIRAEAKPVPGAVFDSAWLSDAVLIAFQGEDIGSTKRTFTIDSFRFPEPPREEERHEDLF